MGVTKLASRFGLLVALLGCALVIASARLLLDGYSIDGAELSLAIPGIFLIIAGLLVSSLARGQRANHFVY